MLTSAQSTVDSLKNELLSLEDSSRVGALNNLAKLLIDLGKYDSANLYGDEIIRIGETLGNHEVQFTGLNIKGTASFYTGSYENAENFFRIGLTQSELSQIQPDIPKSFNNIGLALMYQGNYVESIDFLLESSKIDEILEDKAGIAGSYNNIAMLHSELGNYELSLSYYEKSLVLKRELKDAKGIFGTLTNIGVLLKGISKNRIRI